LYIFVRASAVANRDGVASAPHFLSADSHTVQLFTSCQVTHARLLTHRLVSRGTRRRKKQPTIGLNVDVVVRCYSFVQNNTRKKSLILIFIRVHLLTVSGSYFVTFLLVCMIIIIINMIRLDLLACCKHRYVMVSLLLFGAFVPVCHVRGNPEINTKGSVNDVHLGCGNGRHFSRLNAIRK